MVRRDYFTADNLLTDAGAGFPELIEIEPIHVCNFRCIQCHVPYETLSYEAIDFDALRRSVEAAPWLSGRWAIVGASHEPTMHPRFSDIICLLTDAGMKIDLTTNGSMFTDKLISKIRSGRFVNVTVSFDGARRDTYERIRRNADYQRTLDRVRSFRDAIGNEITYYSVNYTILKSNIDEIVEAVDLWDSMDFDHIGFIAMVRRSMDPILDDEILDHSQVDIRIALFNASERIIDGQYRITASSSVFAESEIAIRFTHNVKGNLIVSDNPDAMLPINPRPFFQEGNHPDVPVACRSPYASMRILFNGNALLCNQYVIGNIKDQTIGELWAGHAANEKRAEIKSSAALCHACDFYKFCIKAGKVDIDDPGNWKSSNLR